MPGNRAEYGFKKKVCRVNMGIIYIIIYKEIVKIPGDICTFWLETAVIFLSTKNAGYR
ncbi:MAG: hypothetical protein WDO19_13810 [Bacteroidota bacterium]